MENKCVNNLRVLSLYEIERACSGHPGIALSSAPILYSLYSNVMTYSPTDDKNVFRDRFVMSAGHGSALLYSTLHMFGFDISMDDLKHFRRLNSVTTGHPEYNKTAGVDCSTGPLGEGVGNAVGMAIAEKHFESLFNKPDIHLFNSTIYCLVGDGCLMEGLSYEATSLAGSLNLDNLVLIYDCNKRTIDGSIDITWTENVKKRFEAVNFDVFEVFDGNSVDEITENLLKAKNSNKPSIVIVNTILGYGSQFEDNSRVHGNFLRPKQIEFVKEKLNIQVSPFEILDDVKNYVELAKEKVKQKFNIQMLLASDYQEKYPEDYAKLLNFLNFDYNEKAVNELTNFMPNLSQPMRELNQDIFSAFRLENLLGGCADVETSTKMFNRFDECMSKENYQGKRICFGVREHTMGAVANGLCLFGGLMSYASCFLSFADFVKPSLRMSCLMNLPVLYVFTHDNYFYGENGPTHQPVEQIVSLRATPNLTVFRAYNDAELKACYVYFLLMKKPTALLFSRAEHKYISSSVDDALKGGYIFKSFSGRHKITLIATGSDVDKALEVAQILQENKVGSNVVSMPSVELFESQSKGYKNSVLDKKTKIFTLESASSYGLSKFVQNGMAFSIDSFGESATTHQLTSFYRFESKKIAIKIINFLEKEKKIDFCE